MARRRDVCKGTELIIYELMSKGKDVISKEQNCDGTAWPRLDMPRTDLQKRSKVMAAQYSIAKDEFSRGKQKHWIDLMCGAKVSSRYDWGCTSTGLIGVATRWNGEAE